jgi:hypothetical protein
MNPRAPIHSGPFWSPTVARSCGVKTSAKRADDRGGVRKLESAAVGEVHPQGIAHQHRHQRPGPRWPAPRGARDRRAPRSRPRRCALPAGRAAARAGEVASRSKRQESADRNATATWTPPDKSRASLAVASAAAQDMPSSRLGPPWPTPSTVVRVFCRRHVGRLARGSKLLNNLPLVPASRGPDAAIRRADACAEVRAEAARCSRACSAAFYPAARRAAVRRLPADATDAGSADRTGLPAAGPPRIRRCTAMLWGRRLGPAALAGSPRGMSLEAFDSRRPVAQLPRRRQHRQRRSSGTCWR